MFPAEKDPTGGTCFQLSLLRQLFMVDVLTIPIYIDPSMWADSELRRWLHMVRDFLLSWVPVFQYSVTDVLLCMKRNLLPSGKATREELIERVRANLRSPPRA